MSAARWSAAALATAVVTSAILSFAPVVSTSSCSASPMGAAGCSSSQESLVSTEGAGVVGVLAVPVILTLVPVARGTRRSRWISATALTVGVLVAAASIGAFYLPTVALAWIAVPASRREVLLG